MPYDMPIYDYDEKRDGKDCWLHGAQWATPPWTPLFLSMWFNVGVRHGCTWGYDKDKLPTTKGLDFKLKDGQFYITSMVTTEEERKEREPMWRERVAPILEDPFGHWERLRQELVQLFEPFAEVNLEKLSDCELVTHLQKCFEVQMRVNEIHNWPMVTFNHLVFLFQDIFQQVTGIPTWDPKYSKLMSGFNTSILQANRELAGLATSAIELGLRELFDSLAPEGLLSRLEESDAGRKWLGQLQQYLKVWGLRRARVQEICVPTWREKPSLAIPEVKKLMAVEGVYAPEVVRERLVKEREETEKEVLALVPEEQKEWFTKLMRAAQAGSLFSEDHVYYCEYNFPSIWRLAAIEAGKRFVGHGILDDPEDVIYMLQWEIVYVLSLGGRYDLRPLVKRRKEEYERNCQTEAPLFIGDMTKAAAMAAADPILAIGGAPPIAAPEDVGATVVGAAGAPGVVEGTARVIMSFNDLDQLQPGEILVTIFTAAEWTPAFSIIKAVVTDVGGTLCHAAILAREYGIPAVVGTQAGTSKIKTGQKIKVDGNMLRVNVIGE